MLSRLLIQYTSGLEMEVAVDKDEDTMTTTPAARGQVGADKKSTRYSR